MLPKKHLSGAQKRKQEDQLVIFQLSLQSNLIIRTIYCDFDTKN